MGSSSNDDLTSNLDFFQDLASSSLKKGFDGMLSNVDASESLIENENEAEINEDIELMIAVGI